MHLSVIVSTYNQPAFLERVLWGYAVQTRGDFELLVADDGSGPETRALIDRLRVETGREIRHVWHEDRGFRKSEIMNRAILASSGDYLLFTDGDSIPRADLVDVHITLAKPGHYLAGGYLKLSAQASDRVTVEAVRDGRATDLRWLRAQGWRPGHRALRMVRSRAAAALLDRLTPTAPLFAGNNASTWREAIFAVNGFDQAMGYGGLDRAVGYRLRNLGIRPRQVRHRAICVHLHHERPYRRPEVVRANKELLERIRRTGDVRAGQGLAELAAAAAAPGTHQETA
ncbi:MAG TPA: glycosyltransferase [Longimicrobiaceae bacterium]|nr:glycosyltransferase [Longimicrobiaceae bacterium]